ncbi:MAG: hypothetical protein ABIG42_00810 [bacterium]
MKNENGYTITELLIIIVLLAITFGASCSGYNNARMKAREAEVKSNIHGIQIALERYGVDSGGIYPLMLYGGSPDDTFTVSRNFQNVRKDDSEYSEFEGDVDVLLEFGYLFQYPVNPFQPKRNIERHGKLISQPAQYNLPQLDNRIAIWSNHIEPSHGDPDRSKQLVEREVGGIDGNLMWDVSEGQRHSPFPIVLVPDPDPNAPINHYHYINPKTEEGSIPAYKEDHLFFHLPGNFYYYATFNTKGGYASIENTESLNPRATQVIGYNLAGYGVRRNSAQDVYNIFGDYPERSLNTQNNPNDSEDKPIYDIRSKFYAGHDGRNDGVIIVVQHGRDRMYPTELN